MGIKISRKGSVNTKGNAIFKHVGRKMETILVTMEMEGDGFANAGGIRSETLDLQNCGKIQPMEDQAIQSVGSYPKFWSMNPQTAMTPKQSFFAVFCIEALADDLGTTGDKVYRMLTENSSILDDYLVPCYDSLHTQGKDYIVRELKELMQQRGVLGGAMK